MQVAVKEVLQVDHKQIEFLKAYEPCHESFVRYCSARAYGLMETQDLIQDVLLSAYHHFDAIKCKNQLLHYLIRAAKNRSISTWRKSRVEIEMLQHQTSQLVAPGISPHRVLEIQEMYAALNQLPEKQRDAVILFEISGFSIREIAEIQRSTVGAVKTKISRGRNRLRRIIERNDAHGVSAPIPNIRSAQL